MCFANPGQRPGFASVLNGFQLCWMKTFMPWTILLKLMMPGTTRWMPSPVGSSWLFGGFGPMMQKIVRMAPICSDVPFGVATTRILAAPPQKSGGSGVVAPGVGKLWTMPQPYDWYSRSSVALHVPDPTSVPLAVVWVKVPVPVAEFGLTLNSPSPVIATLSPFEASETFGTSRRN